MCPSRRAPVFSEQIIPNLNHTDETYTKSLQNIIWIPQPYRHISGSLVTIYSIGLGLPHPPSVQAPRNQEACRTFLLPKLKFAEVQEDYQVTRPGPGYLVAFFWPRPDYWIPFLGFRRLGPSQEECATIFFGRPQKEDAGVRMEIIGVRGSPHGILHPWARWDRGLADFRGCSRDGACAFVFCCLRFACFGVLFCVCC